MRPQIKPDLSAQIAEYERKHGAVETTPIAVKDNPASRPPNSDRARDRAHSKRKTPSAPD